MGGVVIIHKNTPFKKESINPLLNELMLLITSDGSFQRGIIIALVILARSQSILRDIEKSRMVFNSRMKEIVGFVVLVVLKIVVNFLEDLL